MKEKELIQAQMNALCYNFPQEKLFWEKHDGHDIT